jgi:hypothetical protein
MANYFTDLEQLDRVDWPLLNSRNFTHDPDDSGKKERYQAEALVWKCVPLKALTGICCYTEAANTWINSELDQRGLELKTTAQTKWYF